MPIEIPEGVTIKIADDNTVIVKGPLGEMQQKVHPDINLEMQDKELNISRATELKRHKSMHGLYRMLIHNMVYGVSKGFQKKLELIGVGFRAEAKGQQLEMNLGYSHDFIFQLPPEVKVETLTEKRGNPKITLSSADKQLLGQVAAKIRSLRPPEPYKGKGVRYIGEYVRKKAGKTGV
jgi:large subunit ribosomal protein L6